MKQYFKTETGTPFHVDTHDRACHTIVFGPTRIGMSCLQVFTNLLVTQDIVDAVEGNDEIAKHVPFGE